MQNIHVKTACSDTNTALWIVPYLLELDARELSVQVSSRCAETLKLVFHKAQLGMRPGLRQEKRPSQTCQPAYLKLVIASSRYRSYCQIQEEKICRRKLESGRNESNVSRKAS